MRGRPPASTSLWLQITLACAALAFTPPSLAAAPAPPEADCPATPAAIDTASEDPCHLHAQARAALEQGQWLQAELLLERILMLHPNDAQAMLQLAMVLAARDKPASAQALIAALRDDERTSAAHRQRLQALLQSGSQPSPVQDAALARAGAPGDGSSGQIVWSLGHSRNPLARPRAETLVLTLPGGSVELPLADRPRPAALASVLLHQRWAGGLELLASAQGTGADGAHAGARLALAAPLHAAAGLYWNLSSQQGLDGARRHSAGLLLSPRNAAGQGGAAPGGATLYSLALFSEAQGARRGLALRAQRGLGALTLGAAPLRVDGWAEWEHALGAAPGTLRAGAQAQWSWAPGWQLHAQLDAQRDLRGYSPLLRHGAARAIASGYLALQHQWATPWLGGQWAASAYVSRRRSNLALFDSSDHGVALSWQRGW
ncbi:tetratricopeptide repeat protein [Melaminivora sp.]|uniref:tetratricopeptide repeat protein n=1 Tax=Melaminivora sp. TaxID=1933032 RepID=UPI0028A97B45|nr:tetratricopeptide repeat protein [Melaminivora sp.]